MLSSSSPTAGLGGTAAAGRDRLAALLARDVREGAVAAAAAGIF
jgi:hypothetical protein